MSRYSVVVTSGALAVAVLWALLMVTGTWSPTCSLAVWLSRVTSLGAEITSTSVIDLRVSTAALMSLPI